MLYVVSHVSSLYAVPRAVIKAASAWPTESIESTAGLAATAVAWPADGHAERAGGVRFGTVHAVHAVHALVYWVGSGAGTHREQT